MKNLYGIILAVFGVFLSVAGQAQNVGQDVGLDTARTDKEFANPSVEGTPRGRFLVFRYERAFNYDFNSRAHHLNVPDPANKNVKIEHSNISEIKGYIPVWNRPHLKTVLGIGYEREEFNFKDNEGYDSNFLFHRNLQDKGLKSLSAQLAILRPINYRNYWVLRLKGQLNGDYTSDELNFTDYMRTTAEALYGWKINKNFSWGIGAQFGYNFGRKSVYPAILYNRTFNEHWGVESVFPANVNFRYRSSDKSFFYGGYNLDGYSYVIKVDKPPFLQNGSNPFGDVKTVELRHNDVKLKLRWEREIYDFLWFSLEGGYRINVSYDVFEEGTKRKTKLIATDAGSAPYAQAEVYFVVPKRIALKR